MRIWSKVPCSDDGMEAIVFTAEGDMRQVRILSIDRVKKS